MTCIDTLLAARGSRAVARANGAIEGDAAAVLQALGLRSSEVAGVTRMSFVLSASEPTAEAVHGTITADSVSLKTQTGTFTEDGPWRFRLEDGAFAPWQARGLASREAAVVSRAQRDADPCRDFEGMQCAADTITFPP